MLLSIEGEEATVKSTLALTAPLPIVMFAFDIGEQRAINGKMYDKYFKGLNIEIIRFNRLSGSNQVDAINPPWKNKDITVFELPQPIQLDTKKHEGYIALWDYFIGYLGLAVSDGSISSIIIDTATIARRIKVDAYLEELNVSASTSGKPPRKQLLQIEYGPANDAIRNIYSVAASVGKNFIAVHHLRDEYKPTQTPTGIESMPTGNRVLEGLDGTARFFDVCIRNEKDKKTGKLKGTFVKCGYNLDLENSPIPEELLNWDSIVDMISGSLGGRLNFGKRGN